MIDYQKHTIDLRVVSTAEGLADHTQLTLAVSQLNDYMFQNISKRDEIYSVHYADGTTVSKRLGRMWIICQFWVVLSRFKLPIVYGQLAIETTNEITQNVVSDTCNYLTMVLSEKRVDYNQSGPALSDCNDMLTLISSVANDAEGNTINLFDLCQACDRNPELEQLLNFEIQPGQPSDIERQLKQATQRAMKIMVDEDTCFRPFLESKTGMNPDQFQQTMIAVGLKPNYVGDRAYDHVIHTSFLNGLRNIQDMYVNACSARKASMIKAKQVPDAGHLQRRLQFLTIDCTLNTEVHDCRSQHLIHINIDSEATAKKLIGRYFLKADGQYDHLTYRNYKNYIGLIMPFRSPIGCRAPICRTCYGDLADINYDVHLGINSTLLPTNKITQKLLSAKHLLQTDSAHIEVGPEFEALFNINLNRIHINLGTVGTARIYCEDLYPSKTSELVYTTHLFYVVNEDDEETPFEINVELIPGPMWAVDTQAECIEVDMESFADTNTPLFYAVILNKDISYSLERFQNLLMRQDHGGYNTLELTTDSPGLVNAIIGLLNDVGLDLGSVHLEVILSQLMFTREDIPSRLNLQNYPNQPGFPDYILKSVESAIRIGPSVMRSVLFERLKQTLTDPSIYMSNSSRNQDVSILEDLYLG